MTEEEYQAAMDKIWTQMAELDKEGIDLNPGDQRRQFIATCEGVIFSQDEPVTGKKKAEVEAMWEKMTGRNYSPEKKKQPGKN